MRVTLYASQGQFSFLLAVRHGLALSLISPHEIAFLGDLSRLYDCDIRDPNLPDEMRTSAAIADINTYGYVICLVRRSKTVYLPYTPDQTVRVGLQAISVPAYR